MYVYQSFNGLLIKSTNRWKTSILFALVRYPPPVSNDHNRLWKIKFHCDLAREVGVELFWLLIFPLWGLKE